MLTIQIDNICFSNAKSEEINVSKPSNLAVVILFDSQKFAYISEIFDNFLLALIDYVVHV